MTNIVFPLPGLTTVDYSALVKDEFAPLASMSLEAYSIISLMVGTEVEYRFSELHDACSSGVARKYNIDIDSFTLQPEPVEAAIKWLLGAGIIRLIKDSPDTKPKDFKYNLEKSFRSWLVRLWNLSPQSTSLPTPAPQPHPYAAFSELADTAILDPRLRDILSDIRYVGEKATRVLAGS